MGAGGGFERRVDDQLAAGGPYLTGSSFTIADIPVGLVVNRWFAIDFKKPRLDAVAAFVRAEVQFSDHPYTADERSTFDQTRHSADPFPW